MYQQSNLSWLTPPYTALLRPYFSYLYRVFQGFRQAKSANGGSILISSQFLILHAASKNKARFKSGQSGLKNDLTT